MDGGYINEGGQLKSKNGQKYIINSRPDGFFITKRHAILIAALIFIVMLAYTVLVYFLMAKRGSAANPAPEKLTASIIGPVSKNEQTTAANLLPEKTTQLPPVAQSSRAIKLNEGWSPTLYRLVMQPNIEKGISFGHVVIDIVKDANAADWPPIVLDINNITINRTQVFESSETLTSPVKFESSYGENNETFIIKLTETPKHTKLQLNVKFTSHLSSTLQGFYKVSYDDIDDTKKWLVSTQFSPIDARRAFPCFDRPDKKAQFEISLIHDEKLTMVLSNMPSKNTTRMPHSEYIREDFHITPNMSTYLVAFMATNLVKTNVTRPLIKDGSLPDINIWSRKEVADMTQFTYDLTTKILPFYENYFGIRFNLPKIDMVAVPEFGFSAMENWGLITFRESALLIPEDEENRSSADHTEHVATILAHELAHQWFGNLVTMKYWDDLWLKEGFATFMSYIAINEVEPSWRYLEFFAINELQNAMQEDSDLSSHAISFDVKNSTDIRRIFDPISYSKGASIIRMMQSFLGEEAFKDALTKYLKDFQYKNAVHNDLWNVMTEFGHKYHTLPDDLTVKDIMDTWTIQAGYPILSVSRDGTNIQISQKRFIFPNGANNSDSQAWHVPITYVTQANQTHQSAVPLYWLKNTDNLTLENVVEQEHWIYFNVRRSGYYRVNYDYKSWIALIRNYDNLPEIVIAQLIDDSLNLARAEVVSYDIPLTFLLKLRANDVLPWAATTSGIQYITDMLNREPAYEHFRALMRYIIKPIYNEMGFDEKSNETHVELMHRAVIVEHACFFSHDWCVNRAQLIYREWMRDKTQNKISPNLKGIIYCTALREGSFQEWYFAYNRYLETTSASEKELILDALGCTTKPWLLAKYLNMTITTTSGIRKQDGRRAFIAVAKNNLGFEIAFDFLMSNIKEISDYFGDGFSTISKMINSITQYMNKEYHLEQLDRFKTKADSLGLKAIRGSIELAEQKVKSNIYWRSRSYYKLQSFLTKLTQDLHINLY